MPELRSYNHKTTRREDTCLVDVFVCKLTHGPGRTPHIDAAMSDDAARTLFDNYIENLTPVDRRTHRTYSNCYSNSTASDYITHRFCLQS